MKTQRRKEYNINVITLGCAKNRVDSEVLIHQLKANDIEVAHESEEGKEDVVVINTCGFIESAKEESINTILASVEAKNRGELKEVYVTGCLSERYKPDLQKEIPDVDAYFGTRDLPALLNKLGADYKSELVGERQVTTPNHYAYVKISEGCNRTCSFCAIPLMRGKHISKPIEELVQEATKLAAKGVKELLLIAQELTYYGLDIYKERKLAELINALSEVNGIEWIRLHYAYPNKFPLEVLDVIRENPKVCKYLDIPLQHISDRVLKGMKRQITKAETVDLVQKIREKVPSITLRTTMLVGFPGETEEDFQELCDFIEEMQFERVGTFIYSHEESTSAFELEDNVPQEVKLERQARLMDIQQEISFEMNQAKVGKTYKVLFDRVEGAYFVGRTQGDSPDIDNEVLVPTKGNYVRVGDFAQVEIKQATDFDLYGEVVK